MEENKKKRIYPERLSLDDLDGAAELEKLYNQGKTDADIQASINDGITKELNDDHDYINVTAMGKLAELSEKLKAEMLAVESLEELEAFFVRAEKEVESNRYFATMVNILYDRYYKNEQKPELTYNPDEYGKGAGFANLYKAWLDMHGLWKE